MTNNATVNEVVSESALIKRQQREIEELRNKLSSGGDEISDDLIQAGATHSSASRLNIRTCCGLRLVWFQCFSDKNVSG